MTTLSQQPFPPQVSSNSSQSFTQTQSTTAPVGGKATSQAAGPAAATARSYASATKKNSSPPSNTANPSGPLGGVAPAHHGKPENVSPVNGRNPIIPAVPTVDSPATVNGANIGMSATSAMADHARKPSVTISAAGASGYMPNGAPVVKPAGNNRPQFGTFNLDGSPAMSHATPQMGPVSNSLAVNNVNPRITSPTSSPSPIPQPPASGGRPPSTFQGQGNPVNFGSINGDDANRQLRPSNLPVGMPTGPQASHLRRDSSQSQHSDFSNPNMGPGQNRGGYSQQGGRGRAYGPSYNQQMPFSPGPNNYRQNSNQPRGGQNMNQQYSQQRSLNAFPSSPHQAGRSPALGNAQLAHPQHGPMYGQMPMANQMFPPYGGYPPNMTSQVNPQSSLPLHVNYRSPEPSRTQQSHKDMPSSPAAPDFSPISGNFERYLTQHINQGQFVPQGYIDSSYAAFYNQYNGLQQGMYMPPGSPRSQQQQPQMSQQQQFNTQYGNPLQGQQMSRTSSAISTTERPGSTMGKPQVSSGTPAPTQNQVSNRQANDPASKPQSFQKPRKGGGIVIKDPNSGAVMDFGKQVASPAPAISPANATSAPTPPPRTSSQPDTQHHRSESKSVKTDEEKRNDMKTAIAKKMEEDKAEEERKKEEAETKAAEEKKAAEEAEAKALKDKEEAEAKQLEAAKAQMEAEEAEKKAKAEAEEAEKAAAQAKKEAEEKARKEREQEEELDRLEAEYAEMERKEREAEEAYNNKKKLEAEEKARKEAEAATMADDEMKRAEREAEAAEEARLKKLEESENGEARKERTNLFAALKKDAIGTPVSDNSLAETPEESGAVTPSSETASMAPPTKSINAKPKPAALKLETSKPVEPGQRSAQLTSLLSARRLLNINDVAYPSGFVSPNPALNTGAPPGKFNYDRKFLLQFSRVFVEKPSDNWETQLKQIMGDTEPSTARSANQSRGGAQGLGPRQFPANVGKMGQFNGGPIGGGQNGRTLPPNTTSADRFKASSTGGPIPAGRGGEMGKNPFAQFAMNKPGGFPMAPTKSMEGGRAPSHPGMGGAHPNSPRGGPSQRGGSTRGSKGGKSSRESEKDASKMPMTQGQNLEPIKVTANGWKPFNKAATGLAGPAPGGDGQMAPDMVQRKVKSNLNKMTPQNFPKISEQILLIAGQSKDETDGRTLRQVIQLTFEKATDEAHWAQMYAEFCKRMLESMSPEIRDENILDKAGNVVVGGALFRKYLLNRCQTEFERGWKTDLPPKPEGETKEEEMLSDEYYIAAAAKRRGLGLVRFIGELYKLGMLTERIMHQCVHKLVDYDGVPDEAEVESLTSLLKTIGQNLDENERFGKPAMDAYFTRIAAMIETEGLPSRLKFMLMDTVDLRKKGWRTKDNAIKGPTTLDQVRAQAAAAEHEKEMERQREAASKRGGGGGGRPPIGRGDARNFSGGGGGGSMMPPPDYNRNTLSQNDIQRLQSRNTSRQTSTTPQTFGPSSSMFSSARGSNTRKPLFGNKTGEDSGASSRTGTPPTQKEKKDKEDKETSKNAFSALASLDPSEPADTASPAVSPPTSKLQPVERKRSKSPLGQEKDEGPSGSTS
ncbi:MAG: hypothetical protein Q9195_008666 [Heterodermia aff. obscurata]